MGEYFLPFCLFVALIMFLVIYVDHYLVHERGRPLQEADALSDRLMPYFPIAVRIGVSAFFVMAASYSGFILTLELKTEQSLIAGMHLAIAGLVLIPQTAFLAGFGMVALYGYAVTEFGIYHLLDYPIFLGAAANVIMLSLYGEQRSTTALNVMRWFTGVTSRWAGIEKFAFPEWSFGLLRRSLS